MAIDDRVQRHLRDIAAKYHDWSQTYRDHGTFEVEDSAGYWRFAGSPTLVSACAFEILLHPSHKIDFVIGSQNYEERDLEPLEHVLSLIDAIVQGRLITRAWVSSNTATLLKIETLIYWQNFETPWRDIEIVEPELLRAGAAMYKTDRHYPPYKR